MDNEAALSFYKLLGFKETGRIPGYYMGKLDALVMGMECASSEVRSAES